MNRRNLVQDSMTAATLAMFATAASPQSTPAAAGGITKDLQPLPKRKKVRVAFMLADSLLEMTGGLKVKPHYSISSAPQPNVIVVPAQRATDASRAWLREASAGTDVTMSVCTGAFQLARAGLLKT